MEQSLFRKKAMDRISSPEDLTSYLKVTNPGVWSVLAAVIILLAGLFAWAAVGTLETVADAKAIVQDHTAQVIISGQNIDTLEPGMSIRIASQEFVVASVESDEYGRVTAYSDVSLPDGTYEAKVVLEQTRPIEFLIESR
jgi:hypothetical protein